MQSSHRLLSRILHSPGKGYSRASGGGSLHLLLQFDEKHDGALETHRSFSSLIRSNPQLRGFLSSRGLGVRCSVTVDRDTPPLIDSYSSHRHFFTRAKQVKRIEINDQHSQRAVTTALWCNFLVFSLKFGVWWTSSSHVIMAEVVHSVADFANQALLAYGLSSSRRAPDALHPYGYSKERFVWSLISAVGIFCLGSGATIVNGVQNLWTSQPPPNMEYAALVIGGSFIIEGASLLVAIQSVKKGAAQEGMTVRDYIWRGHDPTSVAVMTEDGAAVTGLAIAAASLVAVKMTGNPIYDPIGSIVVGNLLGMVAIFLIQRNRHALIGRAMDDQDMRKVLHFLKNDSVVDALYDCKSEVIGPGSFRFKAEIDFNGQIVVQNYLKRTGREEWAKQFREAAKGGDDSAMLKIMSNYGEEVVTALGSEVDRLEQEIQELVPGIQHVDIEAHNPIDQSLLSETIDSFKV
uniref:Metal tolerance protein C4 n=1 Tax=Noccaea caerulescens TaxID=107243 RepID=A0A1J3IQB7_NOCCA